ncbi:ATP-binding cassette domain-containing protein [Muriicola sp. Z0-33]|uniref:ATP-binding cassette domain-containing protein n=1 Tax=Muriicola sp. Z0-33 TaxID=2816957 RepID=UPI00223710F5|nr:ATP-binding cassette domain-containing protein [Muriicola sp. Z0-33]MCW5518028.1 ATP-binding cassette domain-containing protein [Muriicola sp. Z0-33]
MIKKHRAIFINNDSDKQGLIERILEGPVSNPFEDLKGQQGALFSKLALDKYIEEEVLHDQKVLTKHSKQSLRSMSSGERKKALLGHIKNSSPEFLILDNPFDNLDVGSVDDLKQQLSLMSKKTTMLQIISRKKDLLPFIKEYYMLEDKRLLAKSYDIQSVEETFFGDELPAPLSAINHSGEELIKFKGITVNYEGMPVLDNINWVICKGEFWQLKGKNGSGKTTLLSMITGDNPKGYGQELFLFGKKKGSGESIWEIKTKIGYFTPAMIDRFKGYHSLENMLISGLTDSIGLYVQPSEIQIRIAKQWLQLIGMEKLRHTYFHDLSMGQQRLIMCIRAMIKHPLLLILDEPTAGLDDKSAALFVALVNKIASESDTSIIFVSHREEAGLNANLVYELLPGKRGSTGKRQE